MNKKLVLFGDSLLAQCGRTETRLLEQKLNGEYDVYNCATGGWDTNNLVHKAKYISKLKPDIVFISIGTNDVSPWKLVDLDTFKANLPQIIETFKGSRIIFFPPPPVFESSRPEHKAISNVDVKKYQDAVIDACISHSAEYLDSWNLFMPLQEQGKSYHIEDGVHLNEFAYESLFDELSKVIQS